MDPWGSKPVINPTKNRDRSKSKPFARKNSKKPFQFKTAKGIDKDDRNLAFGKTGQSNTTATTMAFTRELKKDEGYPYLSNAKSSNNFNDIIGEEPNEFSIRNTHNPPVSQNFGSPSKYQAFNSATKAMPMAENDDQWGDFNLFAKEKKKKGKGRFADKFASKLKKEKQFFKNDAQSAMDPKKKQK